MSIQPPPPEPARRRHTHLKGPVTLRGSKVPGTTTDQRLLDSRGPSDWVHTDPWRVMRIQACLLYTSPSPRD